MPRNTARPGRRLPTEAEWELAAQRRRGAGSGGIALSLGNDSPRCADVVIARHEKGSCHQAVAALPSQVAEGPADVGCRPRCNRARVHDLAGNVREWVEDVFQVPYLACGRCENPKVTATEAGGAVMRVVRGGNFMQEPTAARQLGAPAGGRLPGHGDWISLREQHRRDATFLIAASGRAHE